MKKIPSRLKSLRKENNLRQSDLAKVLDFSRTTIANYEQGIRIPPTETLHRIAEYFGVSLDYLTGRSNEKLIPEMYHQTHQPILLFIDSDTQKIIYVNSRAISFFSSEMELVGKEFYELSSFSREELLIKIKEKKNSLL
jgi:transcriptional regulator with XRE-family HTH domain